MRDTRPPGAMLTVAEVAERYGVSEMTVLAWIRAGELRAVNVGRAARAKKPRWRITTEALTEFEASRTPAPAAPRARRKQRDDVIQFYT